MESLSYVFGNRLGNFAEVQNIFHKMKDELQYMHTWDYSDEWHYAGLFLDGKLISVIFYAPIFAKRKCYIVGAYTDPVWRSMGVYDCLWTLFIDTLYELDQIDVVLSGCHKDNKVSYAMQKAQGREFFIRAENPTSQFYSTRVFVRSPWVKHHAISNKRMLVWLNEFKKRHNVNSWRKLFKMKKKHFPKFKEFA